MRKKGISLIVLIITIIVVIILAAVVVLTLSKNNPIESAKEARFREDIRTFQDELALYISKQYANAGGHWDGNISAKTCDEIKNYIPSFTKKYEGKFIINNNNLEYTNELDEKEKEYAQNLNVKEKVLKLLPDEYQQVEYIESTGIQWINTKLDYNNCHFFDIKILMKSFRGTKDTHWGGIFINRFDSNANKSFGIQARLKDNGEEFIVVKDGELLAEYQANKNVIYTLKYDNDGLYINNDKICNRGIGLQNLPGYFPLFGLIDRSVNASKILDGEAMIGQIYYAKFYNNNGIALKKFIPCYSTVTVTNADGVQVPANTKGMYDLVEGKFYTNQGTGEDFIPGPDVD